MVEENDKKKCYLGQKLVHMYCTYVAGPSNIIKVEIMLDPK